MAERVVEAQSLHPGGTWHWDVDHFVGDFPILSMTIRLPGGPRCYVTMPLRDTSPEAVEAARAELLRLAAVETGDDGG